jgi:hypothetical protein
MMKYLQIGALIGLVAFGFWINRLWNENQRLSEENSELVLQAEKTAENMKTLVQQLDREITIRQMTETTLNELMNEVPDVVYTQELPPEIQGVLDRFHDRIRP